MRHERWDLSAWRFLVGERAEELRSKRHRFHLEWKVPDGEQNPLANQIVWIIDLVVGFCFWCRMQEGDQAFLRCATTVGVVLVGATGVLLEPDALACVDGRCDRPQQSPDYPPLRWNTRNVDAVHHHLLGSWVTGDLGHMRPLQLARP